MSLLIFITEPKSWGFSPIQLSLVIAQASIKKRNPAALPQGPFSRRKTGKSGVEREKN